jgi:branched-chain amino acid transport system ATP-binding protein
LLEAHAIESRYGRIRALEDVSLRVGAGEAVAVLGPNGAGKTTLMRSLAGSIRVAAGRIEFDGLDVTGLSADGRARAGVVLCPEGRGVFASLSVERNLVLGAVPLRERLGRRAARDAVLAALERAYTLFPILGERRHAPGSSLSGGQQQMLALARALMGEPKVLLLDEPSLGLAPIVIDELYANLSGLRDAGQTLVIVEESPGHALRLAARAYVLQRGRVLIEGAAGDVAGHPQLRNAYLGERPTALT